MALQGGSEPDKFPWPGTRGEGPPPPVARAHLHPTLGSTAPHRTWPPLPAAATLTSLRSSSNLQREVSGRREPRCEEGAAVPAPEHGTDK